MKFVTWKWDVDGTRVFTSEHVNVLRSMIERHYPEPHTLICITDDPSGLDPRIEVFDMPVTGTEHLVNAAAAEGRDTADRVNTMHACTTVDANTCAISVFKVTLRAYNHL